MIEAPARSLTVPELARRFRISEDKVRAWIRRGELLAVNTADKRSGRPRFVVTADALVAFENRRSASTPTAPRPARRKKTNSVDFYPD